MVEMTLQSIKVENNYGKNTSRVTIFQNGYSREESVELEKQKFQIRENINKGELIQVRIEGLIPEKNQPSCQQKLINELHKINNVWFSFSPKFVISWEDNKTKEKRVFSNPK